MDDGPVGGTVVDDHLTEVDEIFEAAKYFIWQPNIYTNLMLNIEIQLKYWIFDFLNTLKVS